MKISIEPETKEEKKLSKKLVWENVFQYAIAGNMMRKKLAPGTFRNSYISDPNELIGQIEMVKEDIKDHKNGSRKHT